MFSFLRPIDYEDKIKSVSVPNRRFLGIVFILMRRPRGLASLFLIVVPRKIYCTLGPFCSVSL